MIRLNLVQAVALFAFVVGCSSSETPTETPAAGSGEPTSEAKSQPPPEGVVCTDDQSCTEQGALAKMVGDNEKAKATYKKGCELKPDGTSCKELEKLGK